jgi:hypothetical protein
VNHKYTNIKVEINEPHQHRDMPRQSKLKVQEMQSQKKRFRKWKANRSQAQRHPKKKKQRNKILYASKKTGIGPVYLACKPKIFPLPPITSNL